MLDFKPVNGDGDSIDNSSSQSNYPLVFTKHNESGAEALKPKNADGQCCAPGSDSPSPMFEVFEGGNEGGCCTTSSDPVSTKRTFLSSTPALPRQESPMIAKATVGFREYLGMFLCRISKYRNHYVVKPGLYRFGNPDEHSDVFVTANYKYSFDVLRKSLMGKDAYILVLNTKGINVWCAAGKGTFGTSELVSRIRSVGLENYVGHDRVIVPQLGAPGLRGREVRRLTGFRVIFGPVRADDIPRFLENNYKSSVSMRTVRFNVWDRFVLVPMEFVPYARHAIASIIFLSLIIGFDFKEMKFSPMEAIFSWYIGGAALTYLAGTALVPLLLPWIPFRSFALKGLSVGLLLTLFTIGFFADFGRDIWLILSSVSLFPAVSSYLALQFTGSTTFTGMSGVEKELRLSLPYHLIASGLGAVLFLIPVVTEVFS